MSYVGELTFLVPFRVTRSSLENAVKEILKDENLKKIVKTKRIVRSTPRGVVSVNISFVLNVENTTEAYKIMKTVAKFFRRDLMLESLDNLDVKIREAH